MHHLLRSREFGCTDDTFSLYRDKQGFNIGTEYPNARLERAYFRDGLRKLGLMNTFGQVDPAKIAAAGDVLLRFSAFPGTSMMFTGAHGAPKAVYESTVHPSTFDTQERYHTDVLEALGPIVWHPGFAYAMDVEAPGNVDPGAKYDAQAELISRLRRRWKSLEFVCSTRNWSNPSDLCKVPGIARLCFYEPFGVTHWWIPEMGLDAPVPYPLTQAMADKIIATSPRITERGKREVLAAVGFGKASMEKILRECLAAGIEFLITEAGVSKSPGIDVGHTRWRADLKSVCYKLGIPLMEFSMGWSQGTRGYGYGLAVGL